MRIVITGHGIDASDSPLRSQIAEPLRFLGHEVVAVAPTKAAMSWGIDRYSPEMLIVVPTHGSPNREEVRALTVDAGCVAVCFHTGFSSSGPATNLDEIAADLREYDLVSVPDPQTFEEYQALGTFRLSLLEPAIHPPALMEFVPSERRGVVVVADADPNNIDAVLTLEPVDDLMIFGDGWADIPVNAACIDDLPLLERASLFAGSKLVLELPVSLSQQSLIRRSHYELPVTSCVFEASAVGTPSLVQSRPSVAQTFNPGEEIFTFDKLEELVDLVPLLVSDDKEISAVGSAAWSKITAEHTWAQRWRSFLDPWLQEERLDSRSDFPRTNHSEQLIRAR